ncbi:MAG TPA: MFS transporter [Chloroflexota bacterium]|nr:MFS transporter [Chloroflexota bacterium]
MSSAARNLTWGEGSSPHEVETDIPARIDRLPWAPWHWLIIVSLGITWILDGLEVNIVGAIAGVLGEKGTLHLSSPQIGFAATSYLIGAVCGALFFSYLTDRFGRKNLFMITLLVYLIATVLTAFSWNFVTFALFRFFTGAGIGGEYSAINSAIDELIPARVRGRVDLAINGSWWVGTAVGALATLVLLDPHLISHSIGWRLCFGIGAVLGLAVLLVRRFVPESPRWLMTHGRVDEANEIVEMIEAKVKDETGLRRLAPPEGSVRIVQRPPMGFITVGRVLFTQYTTRSILGAMLMSTQAFLYNAIFFTYALVLTKFYKVPDSSVGLYILPFAVGNFFGPLLLGPLFDTIGRRVMISATYITSGILLIVTGYFFYMGALNAVTQTICWSVVFFFASAGASSGYLTVSEIFPLEIRAMAIALFYALGTGAGAFAPWLFGKLIENSARSVFEGDLLGAGLMILGGLTAAVFAVAAERKSLEAIARPLSAVDSSGRLAPQVPRADAASA